jgi:tRNA-uridine 2-sulfurtransferase
MINPMPKVVVGMSGGVDSSVAAALLVNQGYSVIGIMLRLWSEPGKEGSNRCCTPDSMAQARRVAAQLGIPFYAVDAKEIFHQQVVEYFENGYSKGITPNPCLVCNQKIRWGFLLERVKMLGAEYLATGHYAQIRSLEGGSFQLLEGMDKNKDQSYVLSVLNQDHLSHSLLPLGEYTKPEVRQLARDFNLFVAEKEESQDLCFLGDIDYREYLIDHVQGLANPGKIRNLDGEILGMHEGLAFYTIGQRKGLRIPAKDPYYVIRKELEKNELIIGRKDQLGNQNLIAQDANWISGNPPSESFHAQFRIRYRAAKVWGTISLLNESEFMVRFDQSQRDITPGQSVVIYEDEVCLGNGVIRESFG